MSGEAAPAHGEPFRRKQGMGQWHEARTADRDPRARQLLCQQSNVAKRA